MIEEKLPSPFGKIARLMQSIHETMHSSFPPRLESKILNHTLEILTGIITTITKFSNLIGS